MANLSVEKGGKYNGVKPEHKAKIEQLHKHVDGGGMFSIPEEAAASIRDAIDSVCTHGDAIRLGCTRDGGALCVALYSGGECEKFYLKPSDNVVEFFGEIARLYGSSKFD